MSRIHPKCLLDIPDDFEVQCMVQEILCQYNGTTGRYLIYRDEDGNVYDIGKLFVNLPYLENGVVKYDDDITVIDNAFNEEVTDDLNFLQNIYDMDVGEVLENEVTIHEDEYISYERVVQYTLVINEVL